MMLTLGTGLGCAMIEDIDAPLGSGSVDNIRLGHIELHKDVADTYCSAQPFKPHLHSLPSLCNSM